jgi:hypothetical protein
VCSSQAQLRPAGRHSWLLRGLGSCVAAALAAPGWGRGTLARAVRAAVEQHG